MEQKKFYVSCIECGCDLSKEEVNWVTERYEVLGKPMNITAPWCDKCNEIRTAYMIQVES